MCGTVAEQILWTQRIQREQAVAERAGHGEFSLRTSVSRFDVPTKFKPCQIDPSKDFNKGFDPADHGWDPNGKMTAEFRKNVGKQSAVPRHRYAFPQTSSQESSWLLAPRRRLVNAGRSRSMGQLSRVAEDEGACMQGASAAQNTLGGALGMKTKSSGRRPSEGEGVDMAQATAAASQASLANPSALWGGAAPTQQSHGADDAAGSHVSAARPSQVGMSQPSQLSAVQPSQLSRCTSLPSMPGLDPEVASNLRRGNLAVARAMDNYRHFAPNGELGNRWFKPLGETEVTEYANAFMKATSGVPPHKWGR